MTTLLVTVAFVILAGTIAWFAQSRARMRGHLHAVLSAIAEQDDADHTALIEATREDAPQNLAWPPGVLAGCVEKLPPRIARDPCGCMWFEDGLWSPCRIHDSGLITSHLDRWEQELSDQ